MTERSETLTAVDPEPPPGTVVRDGCGRDWERYEDGPMEWEQPRGGDRESWTKVAGNYGPVTVIEWGKGE